MGGMSGVKQFAAIAVAMTMGVASLGTECGGTDQSASGPVSTEELVSAAPQTAPFDVHTNASAYQVSASLRLPRTAPVPVRVRLVTRQDLLAGGNGSEGMLTPGGELTLLTEEEGPSDAFHFELVFTAAELPAGATASISYSTSVDAFTHCVDRDLYVEVEPQ